MCDADIVCLVIIGAGAGAEGCLRALEDQLKAAGELATRQRVEIDSLRDQCNKLHAVSYCRCIVCSVGSLAAGIRSKPGADTIKPHGVLISRNPVSFVQNPVMILFIQRFFQSGVKIVLRIHSTYKKRAILGLNNKCMSPLMRSTAQTTTSHECWQQNDAVAGNRSCHTGRVCSSRNIILSN